MAQKSLDDYKHEISLVDFMLQEQYGFRKSKEFSPNSPKIERVNEQGIKEEVYIIKRNEKGFFTFWSPYDDNLKGKTIIDFVQDKHKLKNGGIFHLGMVRDLLDKYMKGEKYIAPSKSNYANISLQQNTDVFKLHIKECTPYVERSFLHDRGINDKTIDHPMFKDIIKNKIYEKEGRKFVNTAYLMLNETGIGAINIRNKSVDSSFSGALGDRGNSLIMTQNSSLNLDKLIITESFEDAMAHYQLNEKELSKLNVRYIATAGSLSEGQIPLIEKIIEKQQPKEFVIGFDNDIAGAYYRAKLMGKLQINNLIASKDFLEETGSFAHAFIDCKRDNKLGIVDVVFANKDREEGIFNVADLKEYVKMYNEKHKDFHFEGEPFQFTVKLADDNKAIGQITFNNVKEHWQLMGDFIEEIKYEKGLFFKQELATGKDFNEDLKEFKGEKNNTKENNNDLLIGF